MNEINKKFTWSAPEFTYYSKDKKWYWYTILISIVLIVTFILLKIYSGAAVVVAAALVLFTQGNIKPSQIEYTIDNEGIHYKNKNLIYSQLKSFWIVPSQDHQRLYLQKTGKYSLPISISLINVNTQSVRTLLSNYLPEEEDKGEMIHENINKIFRF